MWDKLSLKHVVGSAVIWCLCFSVVAQAGDMQQAYELAKDLTEDRLIAERC